MKIRSDTVSTSPMPEKCRCGFTRSRPRRALCLLRSSLRHHVLRNHIGGGRMIEEHSKRSKIMNSATTTRHYPPRRADKNWTSNPSTPPTTHNRSPSTHTHTRPPQVYSSSLSSSFHHTYTFANSPFAINMKTSFCAVAGLVVAAGLMSSTAQASGVVTAQVQQGP